MIIERQTIAQQATEAANAWVMRPELPKPANPYDAEWAPEHHAEYQKRFEIALLRQGAADSEASA